MRTLLIFLFCLFSIPVLAVDRITATITFTNAPTTNGMTLTVNGDTRTWTNNVVTPASQIATNSTIGGSATNYWTQLNSYPYSGGLIPSFPATNQINLIGTVGGAMTVSFAGNYASVSYSTQSVSSMLTVRVPLSGEQSAVRANISSLLAQGLGDYATNGPTNLLLVYSRILSPTMTNATNYGNAFSSPGTNSLSEQFGAAALANGANSLAVGNGAFVGSSGYRGIAIGLGSVASLTNSMAIGTSAEAGNINDISLGVAATSGGGNSMAIGFNALATQTNSIAIGSGVTTSRTNQIMLGDSSYEINIPGYLTGGSISNMTYSGNIGRTTNGISVGLIVTNSTVYGTIGNLTNGNIYGTTINAASYNGTITTLTNGVLYGTGLTNGNLTNFTAWQTNIYGGIRRYPRQNNTSLANGNNAGVDFGAVSYVKIKAGPTGAFAICGIAGGADGRFLVLVNRTGQNMTISNDSGVEPTAANRIYTLTGADVATTADGAATLIYDSEDSRWNLISIQQ